MKQYNKDLLSNTLLQKIMISLHVLKKMDIFTCIKKMDIKEISY